MPTQFLGRHWPRPAPHKWIEDKMAFGCVFLYQRLYWFNSLLPFVERLVLCANHGVGRIDGLGALARLSENADRAPCLFILRLAEVVGVVGLVDCKRPLVVEVCHHRLYKNGQVQLTHIDGAKATRL